MLLVCGGVYDLVSLECCLLIWLLGVVCGFARLADFGWVYCFVLLPGVGGCYVCGFICCLLSLVCSCFKC